jgi:hypothetical protein
MKKGCCDMYKVVGLNGKEMRAESFTEALKILYGLFPESIAQGKILKDSEKACYIEAVGETATARMYYPYVFEFAVKAGLIRNGKLVEPPIEPTTTELIAAFSRVAVLQFTSGMGCH